MALRKFTHDQSLGWHICVDCRKSYDYQCLCCPLYSVRHVCLGKVEFVQLRNQNKGFCRICLNRVILIENNVAADSDMVTACIYPTIFQITILSLSINSLGRRENVLLISSPYCIYFLVLPRNNFGFLFRKNVKAVYTIQKPDLFCPICNCLF